MFKPLPQVYSRELPAFPERSQELPLTKNSGFFPIGLKDLGELIHATCVSALEAGAILKRFVPAFQMRKYHERVRFQRLADLISKRLSSV